MKILVTGASGFIGRNLINELLLMNVGVVGVVRNQEASLPCDYKVVADFASFEDWQTLLQGCDAVVHLAARVHVLNDRSPNSLQDFLSVNVHATSCLAREAAIAGVKRFIFVSSIGVNGVATNVDMKFTENSPCVPHDDYSLSKCEAEKLLLEISSSTGMEVTIVRPPLVYGSTDRGNFFRLLKLLSYPVPLPFRSVKNLRSFIYVGNLVSALILCLRHPAAAGKCYLVSDQQDISTPALITKVRHLMKGSSLLFSFPVLWVEYLSQLLGFGSTVEKLTASLEVDSSEISRDLGWKPKFKFDDGLKETVDWFMCARKG